MTNYDRLDKIKSSVVRKGNDMKLHKLKIVDPYFTDVFNGVKTFEVRKNDRDFEVGDIVRLILVEAGKITPFYIEREITYILDNPDYCKEGYVIFGISKL